VGVVVGVWEGVEVAVVVVVAVATAVTVSVSVGVKVLTISNCTNAATIGVGSISGPSTSCTCQANKLIGISNVRKKPMRRRIRSPLPKVGVYCP
jgi:hypothetical protein